MTSGGEERGQVPQAIAAGSDDVEYYSIAEAALQHLPEEWRVELKAIAEDGRAVLSSVDDDLTRVSRLAGSYLTIEALKHIQRRLTDLRFSADLDVLLELDMLTLAFVVTYARLFEGGEAGGFSRKALPGQLRPTHDKVVELRNRRFAHNGGHHTVSDALEVVSDTSGETFEIRLGHSFQVQVGGDPLWRELVEALDGIFDDRMRRSLDRLRAKTGRQWTMATDPAPYREPAREAHEPRESASATTGGPAPGGTPDATPTANQPPSQAVPHPRTREERLAHSGDLRADGA